ncbi:MC124 [Molluscum contagiosum virus subtype 2]|uniref:MC124 n=2 Tax=Molluscum contagiosum virus TaxID=10279 RepID=A0A1S7DMF5_MCV2|nr:MC124 [Molluscum contagiosum virus subtype 2]QHW16512.1 MC124L [Molluscum contagiosum virus]AYO87759.1 MC124 [Molluscum contagiosum virus subtype 2]AYO87929.1 MC124 [Molluscum contagiosum virus subtype 2]AYO88099.1 MC124 [Molluscum contagiosum virus subtype 2]
MDASGAKQRRRKRKPRTTVEEPPADSCTTCSVCQSRLAFFSDVSKLQASPLRMAMPGPDTLHCAACGSALCPLSEFAR